MDLHEIWAIIIVGAIATILVIYAGIRSTGGDKQSRTESMIESLVNVASGFIISITVWTLVIVPVFKFNVTFMDNLAVTMIFTVISVLRGFLWRRFFNNGIHQRIHKWLSKI